MDGDAPRNGSLGSNHISAYCLTYEEDTEFFRRFQTGEFRQNSNEDAEFFAATMDFLGEHGFEQYEISNYAQPERDCLHNLGLLARKGLSWSRAKRIFHCRGSPLAKHCRHAELHYKSRARRFD